MKTKFFLLVLVFLFVLSVLYPGILPRDGKEKKQNSLIMKELLMQPKKSLAPPKRNIFIKQRANSAANEFSPSGDFQSSVQTSGQKISPDQEKSAMEEARINVKYIGYVKSGKRVVALIILEGQIYAVESGDILEMGVTIGEITPDDMEIFDQGSEPKRITLEGEKP